MPQRNNLKEKIETRTAVCAVIGLGYVGLPLAVELALAGFKVIGIDNDSTKAARILKGESYIPDVPSDVLKKVVESGALTATSDFSVLSNCDTVNICVPTPLNKTRDPDISFIIDSLEGIKPHVHSGMMVILESTTYPGTTDEIVVPAVTGTDMKLGRDIFVAFSPERVDPGNPTFNTRNIPKVVGGATPECTKIATLFYRQFLEKVYPVSTTAVAEMVKIHENTFRSVNIGLVNELALMCDRLGIDVWEVIEGASTKPFGFLPFYPGPGLGGHCIPIDPYYLSWKARSVGFEARFIELAGQVNSFMPTHVVSRAVDALNDVGKALKGARVVIMGVAYKKNIDDLRESPALDIMNRLMNKGVQLSFADPYINTLDLGERSFTAVEAAPDLLRMADLVIIVTDHDSFDYDMIVANAPLILDTRNALKGKNGPKIWRI
ncbi:MAG: nucleotide sugar dehydrogenase [Deltaproteobacteria bacterium]|nr:nucleotide sugar dehydrogenase [Deltaproteobacteria bacterium]